MEWLLRRLEMALPQPVLHGKAAVQVSGQSGRRDPGWVVVREGVLEAQTRVGWLALGMGTQQEGSHQWQLSFEACLCAHICSGTVATGLVYLGSYSLGTSTGVEELRDRPPEYQGRLASGSDPQEYTKIQRPGMTQEEVTSPASPQPP